MQRGSVQLDGLGGWVGVHASSGLSTHTAFALPLFRQWVARAIESAREFFHEHVKEPSQGLQEWW